jgi:hypothetical protein
MSFRNLCSRIWLCDRTLSMDAESMEAMKFCFEGGFVVMLAGRDYRPCIG